MQDHPPPGSGARDLRELEAQAAARITVIARFPIADCQLIKTAGQQSAIGIWQLTISEGASWHVLQASIFRVRSA
jgi:hypothetical protein